MTNKDLIDQLIARGALKTERVITAFREIDRQEFVPLADRHLAYADIPLSLGYGATISQPYTVAVMLELLQPKINDHVLDVGAGSGWTAALLGKIVGPSGSVTAIERLPQLAEAAESTLRHHRLPNVHYQIGDASHGWPKNAPYDIIHVAAAVDKVPGEYVQELKIGGRCLIPVGQTIQELTLVTKTDPDHQTTLSIPGWQFVPLINHHAQ